MNDRPTPEQIIVARLNEGGAARHAWILADLQRHGYVITHPDDVPTGRQLADRESGHTVDGLIGWDECLAFIFGDN